MGTEADRRETQRFAIFDILMRHCNEQLTPGAIEKVMEEITQEMRKGPSSWAFSCK